MRISGSITPRNMTLPRRSGSRLFTSARMGDNGHPTWRDTGRISIMTTMILPGRKTSTQTRPKTKLSICKGSENTLTISTHMLPRSSVEPPGLFRTGRLTTTSSMLSTTDIPSKAGRTRSSSTSRISLSTPCRTPFTWGLLTASVRQSQDVPTARNSKRKGFCPVRKFPLPRLCTTSVRLAPVLRHS